jgi:major intrinsic protein/FG-GAP repeat protein
MTANPSRRTAAEFVGTGFLVAAVVGSGIMAERLAGGHVALAALILTFGPISGAHFNQAITFGDFNGDGKIDVATANSAANTVTIYGDGSFVTETELFSLLQTKDRRGRPFEGVTAGLPCMLCVSTVAKRARLLLCD